jgi:hypothetical protein
MRDSAIVGGRRNVLGTSVLLDQLARQPLAWMRLYAALACALLIGACGNSEPTDEIGNPDQATLNYGYGMIPNAAVTYQPDVIVVGGGPKAIRSASADGLVWIIDGDAPHARDLRPGKILLATSKATGRIIKVEPSGDDLAVTLGPFQLGDILRDADIQVDVALNADNVVYQVVPEIPGMFRDYAAPDDTAARADYVSSLEPTIKEDGSGILLRFAPISLAVANSVGSSVPAGKLPATDRTVPKVTIKGWEIEPSFKKQDSKERLGLKIQRKGDELPLKAGIDLGIWVNKLHFRTRMVFRDGRLDEESAVVVVDGRDNMKVRVEVPVAIEYLVPPTVTHGIPMTAQVKFKFLFETMLGGNNATLQAAGEYTLEGPLGVENGKVITPEVAETDQMIDTVGGHSLGVSGYTFAQETRFLLGLGPPAFFGGPYAKFTATAGVTKSADIAAGLGSPQCKALTIKFDGGGGVGTQLSSNLTAPLERLLGNAAGSLEKLLGKTIKSEWEIFERTYTILNETRFKPDIPACRF